LYLTGALRPHTIEPERGEMDLCPAATLLDQALPHCAMKDQCTEGTATSHSSGGRTRVVVDAAGSGAPGQNSGCNAYLFWWSVSETVEASVWPAEDADGGDALYVKDAANRWRRRCVATCSLTNLTRVMNNSRYQTGHRGDPWALTEESVNGRPPCETVQVAQAWPGLRPGSDPDSIK